MSARAYWPQSGKSVDASNGYQGSPELQKELDAFSQRLEARTREFESRGEFSDVKRQL
jgi:hypothetical protein